MCAKSIWDGFTDNCMPYRSERDPALVEAERHAQALLAEAGLIDATDKCPGCGESVWDKAGVDQRLTKCWGCGLRFDVIDDEGLHADSRIRTPIEASKYGYPHNPPSHTHGEGI